ncbi:MAG: hypothetical protein ACWGQW_18905 [bacterium]
MKLSEDSQLLEKVAQAIYHNNGGMDDEDYLQCFGVPRRLWSDWANDHEGTLCEWERDEYRVMAKAAIEAIEESYEDPNL